MKVFLSFFLSFIYSGAWHVGEGRLFQRPPQSSDYSSQDVGNVWRRPSVLNSCESVTFCLTLQQIQTNRPMLCEFSAHRPPDGFLLRTRWLQGHDQKSNEQPPSLPSNQACDRAHKDTSQSFVHGVAAQSWKLIASYELILRWSYRNHDTHPISISIKRALSGLQRDPSLSQALHLQHHQTEISAGMLFDKINDFNLQIWSGTAGGEQRSLVKTAAARCMDEQTKIYSICVLGISVTCGVEMKKQRRSAGSNHQRSTADLQLRSRS